MKVFISGGCKNGKSSYAQRLAQKLQKTDAPLYYLATMIPVDSEDEARIIRHRNERAGCGFQTIETGNDIITAVEKCDKHGAFLLDSITALLSNAMFPADGRVDFLAHKKIITDLTQLINRFDDMVIVSDYIYSDAFRYDNLTETYRRNLACIDRHTADLCDVVLEICYGTYIAHKGKDFLKEFACEFD